MVTTGGRFKYSGEEFRLRPISDVHLGSSHCDRKAFERYLLEDPKAHFIGLGDLMDCIIVSDVKRYRKDGDSTDDEAIIDRQVDMVVDLLSPHKDRILGLGTGNHEDVITKRCGTDPMRRVCDVLGVPFLGYSWIYTLKLEHKSGGRVRTVKIRGHHGWGGGSRTQGADLTKFSKDVMFWDADLFLYGHVHKKQIDRVPRGEITRSGAFITNPKIMAICGTYLKTYGPGPTPTYAEVKGYPLAEIGGVVVRIKPTEKGFDIRVDI